MLPLATEPLALAHFHRIAGSVALSSSVYREGRVGHAYSAGSMEESPCSAVINGAEIVDCAGCRGE